MSAPSLFFVYTLFSFFLLPPSQEEDTREGLIVVARVSRCSAVFTDDEVAAFGDRSFLMVIFPLLSLIFSEIC